MTVLNIHLTNDAENLEVETDRISVDVSKQSGDDRAALPNPFDLPDAESWLAHMNA